jgi:alpha-beta hydrolase superfamily lysophospholipase
MIELVLTDPFGVDIFTRFWECPDPVGAVLLVHGASEHSGRYDRLARALNQAGYAVASLDQRGHGRTRDVTGVGRTGAGGGDAFIADVDMVRHALATRVGPVPMFLLGHSLGTIVSIAYLGRHADGLQGVVLSGLPANPDDAEASAAFMHELVASGLGDVPLDELVPEANAHLPQPIRTKFDWLSSDDAEVDAYIADPFCGDQNPLTYGLLDDLLTVAVPGVAILTHLAMPVLLISGDQDPTGALGAHPAALATTLRTAGIAVTEQSYPGGRHEMFNERSRDEVTAALVSWLDHVRHN